MIYKENVIQVNLHFTKRNRMPTWNQVLAKIFYKKNQKSPKSK